MDRVVLVDESPVIGKVATKVLSDFGFKVIVAETLAQARSYCEADLPSVLVVDSEMDGALDLIADIRSFDGGKDIRVVYSLVEADLKRMMAGRRSGASDFLLKPFDRAALSNVFEPMRAAA